MTPPYDEYTDEELMEMAGIGSPPINESDYSDEELMAMIPKPPEKSFGGFIKNIGSDIWNTAKGLATVIDRGPFNLAADVGKLVVGGGEAVQRKLGMLPDDYPESPYASAAKSLVKPITESIENPSGIPERLMNYAYEKPFSTAMNVSTGLGVAGAGAKVVGLTRTADVLGKASEITNPVTMAIKASEPVVNLTGKASKEILGATTGAGPGAVEEALQGSEMFKKAMRGEITGSEVVENAKSALNTIKENRAQAYQDHLANITGANQGALNATGGPGIQMAQIDTTPIAKKFQQLASRYNVKGSVDPVTGELVIDTSRVAMGKAGAKDIEDVFKTLNQWGSKPGDNTAVGLDILKRQLDDFYSESSQARGFVAEMRKEVAKTIEKAVPEYGEMTKGYSEASNLISDIEHGLMLRKTGMSGKVVADQTLRRLTSAMRESFELRRELVNALGAESGADIAGQVAGHAMNQIIPHGLVGKMTAGSIATFAHFFNPKLWPILAASSPRAVGEFLNVYGKAQRGMATSLKMVESPNVSNTLFQIEQLDEEVRRPTTLRSARQKMRY